MAVAAAPLKDRVFKIGILNIGSSAPAAEICAGQHNRLLRRQHCSSLCSQSELQCFASDLRRMFAQRLLLLCRYAIWLKTAQRFLWILNTLRNRLRIYLSSAQNAAQREVTPFFHHEKPPEGGRTIAKLSFEARREA